jgi:MoaA/NifB/PqqE/SkfB family radical SAM enzyme
MCDYGRDPASRTLRWDQLTEIARQLDDWRVRELVLTGGEPLLHPRLWEFAALCGGRRRTLLTNGLLLERQADQVAQHCEEVIVSLDGPGPLHDRIRGVPTFAELQRGVQALQQRSPQLPIRARATVQKLNQGALRATAETARQLGLRSISFLALDLTSTEAFGRSAAPASPPLALQGEQIDALEAELEALIADQSLRGFLADSPASLRRIVQLYRAHQGKASFQSPPCNAPWVSAWLRADGTAHPCFFHPAYPQAQTLSATLNHTQAVAFRRQLRISDHPVCRRCVCSLHWSPRR